MFLDGNRAPVPIGPAAPSDLAGCSTSHGSEERGDIIKFYNSIYVQKMQTFAMKFSVQSQVCQFKKKKIFEMV